MKTSWLTKSLEQPVVIVVTSLKDLKVVHCQAVGLNTEIMAVGMLQVEIQ